MGDVTQLLARARAGDNAAWDQAVALVYGDLKHIASAILRGQRGGTLNATGLVHECYLRLAKGGALMVNDRAHFLALAARAMRQLLINHARDHLALKRGAGATHVVLDEAYAAAAIEAEQLINIDQALLTLAAEDQQLVQVVECRIFAGLSDQETATAMALPLRSCQRLWSQARSRLESLLGA
jgi:RNA polymerase sigma factor (TIGR02999 family)